VIYNSSAQTQNRWLSVSLYEGTKIQMTGNTLLMKLTFSNHSHFLAVF